MTDQDASHPAAAEPRAERRSTREEIASSIDLGWRVAALHAMRPTALEAPSPITEDMLLNRRSLPASDRVELEVRAIAGVAARVGVAVEAPTLDEVLALAARSGASGAGELAFRERLSQLHVDFEKRLWASDEPSGKAYELGNFLSDTWNRVLRPPIKADAYEELQEIFSPVRVQRMKRLVDDLQARLDPLAAHAVDEQLGQWRDRVANVQPSMPDGASQLGRDEVEAKLEPVHRQAIIWRQMLTGDKEPEAWIGSAQRAQVRDEFTHQVWLRYRRVLTWLLPLVLAVGIGLAILYAEDSDYVRGLAGTALALAASVGITRASMTSALKRGLQEWGDLMYNRALAIVVCRETSMLDELIPPPRTSKR